MIDFNKAPYYDDYDKDKKFHRLLYNPSRAVQSRELTQQQTILQNQIERFGDHIFKNGSMVIPGQITFDSGMHYVKINTTYGGSEFNQDLFINKKIIGSSSGVVAEVIAASNFNDTDPKTLFVKYTDSGPNSYKAFIDGENLQAINEDLTCTVQGTLNVGAPTFTSTGIGSASSIEAGIYYINGFFVIVDQQTTIVSKYDNAPSVKVGLKLFEDIITADDDISLTDRAIGSYNYSAPGADRYYLRLDLIAIDIDEEPPNDFIELQRIENGTIINEIRTTEYSELEKTFARRTYDESGNYTVSPFNIVVKEHKKDASIPRFADGKYEDGFENKLAIGLESGKAYVFGHEIRKDSITWIETNKARIEASENNTYTNFNIGQFIYVTNMFLVPDLSSMPEITLQNEALESVGTTRIKSIQLVDTTGAPEEYIYKLFLFDIKLNSGTWSQVFRLTDSDPGGAFYCDTIAYDGYEKVIINPTKNQNIFRLPRSFVSDVSDVSYTVQRTYINQAFSGSSLTLSADVGEQFDRFSSNNYIVMDLDGDDASNAIFLLGESDVVPSGGAPENPNYTQVTITMPVASGNVRVLAPVIKTNTSRRSKTLASRTSTFSTPEEINVLDRADGYKLVSVIEDLGSGLTRDVTDRFIFDNGQRNGFYDIARIKLKPGETLPTNEISVNYQYFNHGSGDFCSRNSYTIDYYDIPAFYSEEKQYDLSDCIDFRPVKSSVDTFVNIEFPLPQSNIICDYDHYLPRIDKLYLDKKGEFGIIEGVPALNPKPPKSPDNGMVLYVLTMNAYTFSPQEVGVKFIDNKRYTMRDIGLLENRISNLEYYTSLSLLEKETAQLQIKDDTGLERFKNGFIVEPFNTHGIGDALSSDYRCSIDPNEEIMRAEFTSDSIDLQWNSENVEAPLNASAGTKKTGSLVTLDYTHTQFISQTLASTTENVNPFAVRTFEGKVTFQPDSDNWYDTEKNGELVVNNDAHYEALQFMATYAKGLNGVQWDGWETLWSSTKINDTEIISSRELDRSRPHDTGQIRNLTTAITTSTTTSGQTRTGTRTTSSTKTINKDMGDRTVGINYIPYMRSIPVLIKVQAMKPRTLVYPFFDEISVENYCTPAVVIPVESISGKFSTSDGSEEVVTTPGGSAVVVFQSTDSETNEGTLTLVNVSGTLTPGETITGEDSGATAVIPGDAVITIPEIGDDLKTDAFGRIALVFKIPNDDTLKFRTGERVFQLSDQIGNTEANQTKAKGIFKSEGSMLQQEGTVLSTKTIRFEREDLRQFRTTKETVTNTTTTVGKWFDPLAQTFLIEEEGGCFVTKCDIYFQKKDSSGLPVTFQIREVENGYPSQRIVPYSEVTLYPEDVNASEDPLVSVVTPTTFVTPAPVYLQQGSEYCFVLLSDSFDYNVWIAEIGQFDIVTNEIISKQPYNGVLFKSQNASTWSADQNQDIKFRLYKARFDEIGTNYFINKDLSEQFLKTNPLSTEVDSTEVRVYQRAHGFSPGSFVTLNGFDTGSGTANGITLSDINGQSFAVDNIELDSYTIDISGILNSLTAVNYVGADITDTGRTGFSGAYATRNVQVDLIRPNISELVLPFTSSSWAVKTTTGKSINGNQTPYIKSTSFYPINIVENNEMLAPMMIANRENEEINFVTEGETSLEFFNVMSSNNPNLSPVIDLNRVSCITVANRIDYPEESTHHQYAPESDASGGSAAAKYMTRKISLEEPAGALKIFLTAMVPQNSLFEIWYRKHGPYDNILLSEVDWTKIDDPDVFVPLSQNSEDFREYEYTVEFVDGEEFSSIAIKIVSLSSDTTKVPVFDDLRVICLAT
jgi:hypothetical protein